MRRDQKEKHYIELPFDAVRAVYFGCKIDVKARDELLQDLKSMDWKHVKKYAMRRHHTEYAVQERPWESLQNPPVDARRDFDMLWKALGL